MSFRTVCLLEPGSKDPLGGFPVSSAFDFPQQFDVSSINICYGKYHIKIVTKSPLHLLLHPSFVRVKPKTKIRLEFCTKCFLELGLESTGRVD